MRDYFENQSKLDNNHNVVEHVENYLGDCFMNHLGGLETQETTCYGALLESCFVGECGEYHYEINIKRIVK